MNKAFDVDAFSSNSFSFHFYKFWTQPLMLMHFPQLIFFPYLKQFQQFNSERDAYIMLFYVIWNQNKLG